MKPNRYEVINCPKCGREYLPAEIFYPKHVFGNPTFIVRDVYGKIIDYEGTSMDTAETYTCDHCNTLFQVKLSIKFSSQDSLVSNIDEPYVSSTVKHSLFGN